MLIVQGWARLSDGAIDALEDAVLAMVGTSRTEPGCIDYALARDISDPRLIRISEIWADEPSLKAHFATAHMAAFNAALGGAAPSTMAIHCYEVAGDPQPLMVRDG